MDGILIVTAGQMTGTRVELARGQRVCLGQGAAGTDLQLGDTGVSPRHALVENRNGSFIVTDMHSAGGTFVNEEPLAPGATQTLRSGDIMRLGTAALKVLALAVPKVTSAGGTVLTSMPSAPTPSGPVGAAPATAPAHERTVRRRYDQSAPLGARIDPAQSDGAALARLQGQLEAIYELGNLIHIERDLETLFAIAADTILDVSGGERSAILMTGPEIGAPREVVVRVRGSDALETDFPISRAILDEVLRQGVSMLIGDAMSDHRFLDGVSIQLQSIQSVMVVPVRTEDRITGAIYVDNASCPEAFNESDLQLLAAIGKQVGIALERAELIADLEALFVGTIHTLVATIEAKDQYTKGHSERVTNFALAIADVLGVDRDVRAVVELSGLLHDVGKIGVPEAVLNKAGRLSADEFAYIRQHPGQGARIIQNIENIDRVVDMAEIVNAVLHHHERFNGEGYPEGLKGERVPLAARILTVADTYDAITSNRSYRAARSSEVAAQEIWQNSGSQFDPRCVEAFATAHRSGLLERARHAAGLFVLKRRK